MHTTPIFSSMIWIVMGRKSTYTTLLPNKHGVMLEARDVLKHGHM